MWTNFHNRKRSAEEDGIKTITFPQTLLPQYLGNVSGHLYSFTAQLIQFKVTQRRLITVNVHENAISLFAYTNYFSTCM